MTLLCSAPSCQPASALPKYGSVQAEHVAMLQNVVWERLDNVMGNTQFLKADFQPYGASSLSEQVSDAADLMQAAFAGAPASKRSAAQGDCQSNQACGILWDCAASPCASYKLDHTAQGLGLHKHCGDLLAWLPAAQPVLTVAYAWNGWRGQMTCSTGFGNVCCSKLYHLLLVQGVMG